MQSTPSNPSSEKRAADKPKNPKASAGPEQNFLLFLVRIVAPVLFACLVAFIVRYFNHSASSRVRDIPVSLILKQNLQLAKHSWEHGTLTHALLELQNPELTVFAGPGYGFYLHKPANLEAFPDGKLPKCASEASGSSWGRYDKWTNAKGLRYAAEKIDLEGPWLFNEGGSAADAASLGWAALLLERAGATDPMVPVEARRNLFGEAADRMVRYLTEENPKFLVSADNQTGNEVENSISGRRLAISHQSESKQLWADSVFMVPPFLAAYAVARQNETWLWEAVEQIGMYREVLRVNMSSIDQSKTQGELWRHIVSQPKLLGEGDCCHDEGLWLTGNAWALAGVIRVYGIMSRWNFSSASELAGVPTDGTLRNEARANLKQTILALLLALYSEHRVEDGLLPNYLSPVDAEHSQWIFGDAAGTALAASAVYRSAQLGLIDGHHEILLIWADGLYNAVAGKVNSKGLVEHVSSVTEVPARHVVDGTSEGQSFVLMMFAARRDCVKLKICSQARA